eukprot:6259446-Pyramimonas_sp.AAC.1
MDAPRAICDLALVPTEGLATWRNCSRPLAAAPPRPKMVGGALLEAIKGSDTDNAPWQFAYHEGHSVMDM